MERYEETEEGVHPPETTLCEEHDDGQTEAQRLEQLLTEIALRMESSVSESESESEWSHKIKTGNGKGHDSGVSLISDCSKDETIYFKKRQRRMSTQSGDSSDSDWLEDETCSPHSKSVERAESSDCVVSCKNDGSNDNLRSPLSDRSERRRRHSFPQYRRRFKRIRKHLK